MKREYILSGIISILFGMITYPAKSITGHVLFSSTNNYFQFDLTSWFTSIILVFIGSFFFLNAISGDSLQDRLGEMEEENPSSNESLFKPDSSLKRRKWWGVKRKVELTTRHPENEYTEKLLDPQPDWDKRREIERRYIPREKRQEAEINYVKARFGLKKIEYKTRDGKTSIKKGEDISDDEIRDLEFRYTKSSIKNLFNDLKEEYEKMGGDSNKLFGNDRQMSQEEMINNLIHYYGPVRAALEKNAKNYLSSKEVRKSIRELDSRMRPILAHQEAINGGFYSDREQRERNVAEIRDSFVSKNIDNIPYVELSEASKRGITLAHGMPLYASSRDVSRARYNNPKMCNAINGLCFNNDKVSDGEILLDGLIKAKPALSTFSVSAATEREKFFQPFGIILNNTSGKIYDASSEDLVSRPIGEKSEVRFASSSDEKIGLEERVHSAMIDSKYKGHGRMGHDEFLVGGNYDIKGVYALPEILENERFRSDVYRLSEKYNLPVYTFTEGDGFVLYNEPKVIEKKTPTKRNRGVSSKK